MTTVALERVERLIVVEPRSTTSLDAVVGTTAVDVAIREVTVEPSAFVVVTSIEVGTFVVEGAASVVGVVSAVGVVSGCVVGVVSAGAELVVSSGGALLVELDISDSDDVVSAALVVTPVPTTCLLFGTIPPGSSSAPIWANPRNKPSMTDAGKAW